MRNRSSIRFLGGLSVAVMLLAAWLFIGSPFYALYTLRNAIDTQDKDALADVIDFPVLRQNLKDTVTVFLNESMTKDAGDNPFMALGMLMINAMVDPMINAMITPAGLAGLAKKEMPKIDPKAGPKPEEAAEPVAGAAPNDSFSNRNYDFAYETMNRFVISPKDVDNPPVFVFKRDGLFWKLVDVRMELPMK